MKKRQRWDGIQTPGSEGTPSFMHNFGLPAVSLGVSEPSPDSLKSPWPHKGAEPGRGSHVQVLAPFCPEEPGM